MSRQSKVKDLTGRTFGRWKVIALESIVSYRANWRCQCECGATAAIRGSSLTSGNSTSCGCYRDDRFRIAMTKHGMCDSKVWRTWQGIIQRCTDRKSPVWKHYGGRGIKVCERWLSFDNFYEDVGDPAPNMTIDRIDNNGDYEPGNWRWATFKQQSNNRRSNTWLTAFGRTQTIAQWADETGLKRPTICVRLARGDSHEAALRPLA